MSTWFNSSNQLAMTALDPKKLRKAIAKYREEIAEARSHGAKNEG